MNLPTVSNGYNFQLMSPKKAHFDLLNKIVACPSTPGTAASTALSNPSIQTPRGWGRSSAKAYIPDGFLEDPFVRLLLTSNSHFFPAENLEKGLC